MSLTNDDPPKESKFADVLNQEDSKEENSRKRKFSPIGDDYPGTITEFISSNGIPSNDTVDAFFAALREETFEHQESSRFKGKGHKDLNKSSTDPTASSPSAGNVPNYSKSEIEEWIMLTRDEPGKRFITTTTNGAPANFVKIYADRRGEAQPLPEFKTHFIKCANANPPCNTVLSYKWKGGSHIISHRNMHIQKGDVVAMPKSHEQMLKRVLRDAKRRSRVPKAAITTSSNGPELFKRIIKEEIIHPLTNYEPINGQSSSNIIESFPPLNDSPVTRDEFNRLYSLAEDNRSQLITINQKLDFLLESIGFSFTLPVPNHQLVEEIDESNDGETDLKMESH